MGFKHHDVNDKILADSPNLYQFNYGNVMCMASWGEYKEGIE